MGKASQVLANEDLLGGIIEYALSPCPYCAQRYHPIDSPCYDSDSETALSDCLLRVCQLWFPAAARCLWAEVNLQDVLHVLTMQREPHELDSFSEDGFARWRLYAPFVRRLRLNRAPSIIQETSHLFSRMGSLTLLEPLLPRLSSLLVDYSWTMLEGAEKIVQHVAAKSLETVDIQFAEICPAAVEFLSTYLQIFKTHSERLERLSIACLPAFIFLGYDSLPAPGSIIYDSPTFEGLSFLKELTIDPGLVNFDLLEVLGELQRLEDLLIVHSHELYSLPENIGPSPTNRARKFRSLTNLTVSASSMSTIRRIYQTYLSETRGQIEYIEIIVEDAEIPPDVIEFVGQTWGSLDTLRLNFSNRHQGLLTQDHLHVLKQCTEVKEVEILHSKGFDISNSTLRGFTASWPNIQILILERLRSFAMAGDDPAEMRQHVGPGLDFSCLSIFATGLPNLEYLRFSAQAYDTSEFPDDDASLPEFSSRCEFSFPLTFLNFQRPGFDADKAARYCANLSPIGLDDEVPPEGDVRPFVILNNDATRAAYTTLAWTEYFMDYDDFIASFARKIEEHKAKRRAKLAERELSSSSR